jgi:hypothetical protein
LSDPGKIIFHDEVAALIPGGWSATGNLRTRNRLSGVNYDGLEGVRPLTA